MAPDRIIHMNGRVYDPKLGRMLSPDPVTQAPENGQNYNRYSYAYNNPLKYTDPSGFENKKIVCEGDSCSQAGGVSMGEVLVTARDLSGGGGNSVSQPALTFGAGQGGLSALDGYVEAQYYNEKEALQLENDINNGTVIGKTADGDLVDSDGSVVKPFDYFMGNYDEWGAFTPGLGSALADINAAGFTATAIDGLVGGAFGFGVYYDTELGSMGMYYYSGGGVNLMDGEIVAGFILSAGFVGTHADTADAFFGDSQSTSTVSIPLTPAGVGVTTSVATSSNGVVLSGGVSIGGGQGTSSVTTSKIEFY